MPASLTNAALGEGLGITRQRVSALIREGMPTDSVESARVWREARTTRQAAPLPSRLDTLDDGTLAATIQRHRHLVATAQGVWEAAMAGGDPNQGKYQTAYNQSLKTLINLEEEQERRALNEKVFIKRELAEASVRELASLVLARLEKVGLECAEKCNPDNPALAIKTLDAWVRSVRLDLSSDA
jgi:hypothetical protein